MAEHDAVIVGSGINSLACAALLARGGWSVCVLEREAELGGAIKTAELTEPGFLHDVFSAWHPLWVGGAAHAELGDELAARGLEYLNTEHPTATLFPDGESAFLSTDAAANAAEHGGAWPEAMAAIGAQAELAFGVLGTELWSRAGAGLAVTAFRRLSIARSLSVRGPKPAGHWQCFAGRRILRARRSGTRGGRRGLERRGRCD